MTDHTNAITDILHRYAGEEHYNEPEALQALYEAVVKSLPQYLDVPFSNPIEFEGGKKFGEAVLTNLSLLFGVPLAGSSKQEEASDV